MKIQKNYRPSSSGSGGPGATNTTPAISNVSVVAANTPQSFALPANCKGFLLRSRQIARLKVAYVAGMTNYISVPLGGFFEDGNFYSSQTIYFESTLAPSVIEIVTYV